MPKYPFLSNEWVEEARQIYARAQADGALAPSGNLLAVKVNLIVTEAPFQEAAVDAHVDTSSGQVAIDSGHVSDPDVTVSMGYATARSLFVAGDLQMLMQAFLSGKIRVDGDLSKLLNPAIGIWPGMASPGTNPGAPGTAAMVTTAAPGAPAPPAPAPPAPGPAAPPSPTPVQAGLEIPSANVVGLAGRLQEITE